MKIIHDDVRAETLKQWQPQPYLMLIHLVADANTTAITNVRMTTASEPVTFLGSTYYPWPVSYSGVRMDAEGGLPSITLAIGDSTKQLARYVADGDGFRGRPVTMYFVHEAHVSLLAHAYVRRWLVRSAAVDSESVSLQLSMQIWFDNVTIPHERATDRCQWAFKSTQCSFQDPAGGPASTECPKTFLACKAFGDIEVAANIPRLHPLQFGGYPALPRGFRR